MSFLAMNILAAGLLARSKHIASRFAFDRRGNIIMIFGLAVVPMMGLVGLGVEYFRGINYRTHFDRAADAATLTAITTVRDYISSNPNNEADPTASAIALAQTRGLASFRVNAGAILASIPLTPSLTVSRNGGVVTASASYSAGFKSAFGPLLGGSSTITISGKSASSLTLGNYADFYLLLDTSGSMGFPTSSAAQIQFAKINTDMADGNGNNCAFACHFSGWNGYKIAKANKIELRIQTVSNAVQNLIKKATSNQTLMNQYRIGLYPFVSYMETAAKATNNLSSLASIDLRDYMDIGDSTVPRGSGGTHYENVLSAINAKIKLIGDGTSARKPVPFVFLITDGIGNNRYWNNTTGWTETQVKLLDAALCKPLKDRGITISVLYIPYVPLVKPFNHETEKENAIVNTLIPSIPRTLQSCASPGFFQTASTADQIQVALNAMFDQATRKARLVAGP